MSNITPSGGVTGGSPLSSLSAISGFSPLLSGGTFSDAISSSNDPSDPPFTPVMGSPILQPSQQDFPDFSKIFLTISTASNEFGQQIAAQDGDSNQNIAELQAALATTTVGLFGQLIFSHVLYLEEQALQITEQNDIDTMNNATSAYNNAVSTYDTATEQMNTDITNLQSAYATMEANPGNSQDETAYQNALSTYNQDAGIYNTFTLPAYNLAVATYNSALSTYQTEYASNHDQETDIDQQLAQYNIGPMPAQPTTMPPQVDQASQLPINPTTPPSNITDPSSITTTIPNVTPATTVTTTLAEFTSLIFSKMSMDTTLITRSNAAQNLKAYLDFAVPGSSPILPNSYVQHTAFSTASGAAGEGVGGAGGGVGISSFQTSLSNPNTARSTGQAIYIGLLEALAYPLPKNIAQALEYSIASILLQNGIVSGFQGVRLIQNHEALLTPDSNAVSGALAGTLANNTLNLTSSGAIAQALINNFPSLAQLQTTNPAAFNAIVAAVTLAVLGDSLSAIGISLGLPGLASQVFANAAGLTPTQVSLTTSQGSNYQDTLNNPVSNFYAGQTFSNALGTTGGGVSANTLSNTGFNALSQIGPLTPASTAVSTLSNAFNGLGITDPNTIASLTNLTMEVLDVENPAFLNSPIPAGTGAPTSAGITQNLAAQGYNVNVGGLQPTSFSTYRDLRNQLATTVQTQNPNLTYTGSLQVANNAINPAQNPILATNLNLGTLQSSLTSLLANLPNINPTTTASATTQNVLATGTFPNQAALTQNIQTSLVNNGVPPLEAHYTAHAAVLQNNAGNANPLLTQGQTTVIPPAQLANLLTTQLNTLFEPEVGVELANNISAQVSGGLLGAAYSNDRVNASLSNPTSFLSEINRSLQNFKTYSNDRYWTTVTNTQHELARPTYDAFVTESNLMNPSHNIVMSYLTSIQDKIGYIPKNWQNALDIYV